MKTLRKRKTMHGVLILCAAALVSGACGDGSKDATDAAGSANGGEARFEIVSSWEPSLRPAGQHTVLEYSLTVANRGSSSGEVGCEIWMDGEPLPGKSTSVTIDPGAEGAVEGDARAPIAADEVDLTDLKPRCE
jgi:hypothetical protein